MLFTDKQWVPTEPAATWAALHDPTVLCKCIAGCESLERITDSEYAITLRARIHNKHTRVSGKILVSDEDPPFRSHVVFQGAGSDAEIAIGHAELALEKVNHGGTRVTYTLHAAAGGPLARMSEARLQQYAAKRVEIFFTRFVDHLATQRAPVAELATAAGPRAGGWQSSRSWLALTGILVLIALYYAFGR